MQQCLVGLIERTRHPAPPGLIGLTCNEVQHLFAALAAVPVADTGHRWRCRCGDDDIKHAPAPATTSDKPPSNDKHHKLRLDYQMSAGRHTVPVMVFWQLTIDANDPTRLARFWAQALGYQPVPPREPETTWQTHYHSQLGAEAAFDDRLFDPAGLRPPIWFQQVPETKAGKNRLHLDLYPTGRDNALPLQRRIEIVEAKVAELVGLGASVERRTRHDDPQDPVYYVVMHDPEGNEFCVG